MVTCENEVEEKKKEGNKTNYEINAPFQIISPKNSIARSKSCLVQNPHIARFHIILNILKRIWEQFYFTEPYFF